LSDQPEEIAMTNVELATARAVAHRATLTDAQRAAGDALAASAADLFARMLVGPPQANGRQRMRFEEAT
jgi:hypothetical protein